MPSRDGYILTLTCFDRVGIVAGVAGALADIDGFIIDSQQHADLETGRFFMRVVFVAGGVRFPDDEADVRGAFGAVAARFALDWDLRRSDYRPKIVIAVSKASHCLNDLLYRWRTGVLPIAVVGVVSNHPDLRQLTEWHGVAYHHLPLESTSLTDQETSLRAIFDSTDAELLVLARYMQILSPALTTALTGRCINIHHSFLPSFVGARPYDRAHGRGVKLIGATAHFVTPDLDEGPIIEQAVERVDHRASPTDLARIGRDVETQVLARAVGWWAERRVFSNGLRTVILR